MESDKLTFIFEIDKKKGEIAFRKADQNYKTMSVKMMTLSFTCSELEKACKVIEV